MSIGRAREATSHVLCNTDPAATQQTLNMVTVKADFRRGYFKLLSLLNLFQDFMHKNGLESVKHECCPFSEAQTTNYF